MTCTARGLRCYSATDSDVINTASDSAASLALEDWLALLVLLLLLSVPAGVHY
jgi:hypothetical protein